MENEINMEKTKYIIVIGGQNKDFVTEKVQ